MAVALQADDQLRDELLALFVRQPGGRSQCLLNSLGRSQMLRMEPPSTLVDLDERSLEKRLRESAGRMGTVASLPSAPEPSVEIRTNDERAS
jgi:hypothetical protein